MIIRVTIGRFILLSLLGLWVVSIGIYLDTHVQVPQEENLDEIPAVSVVEPDELKEPTDDSLKVATSTQVILGTKEIQVSKVISQIGTSVEVTPAASAPIAEQSVIVFGNAIQEKTFDIRTVVLVRCLFQTQYFSQSSQPWNEQEFNVGSGVIISSKGYVLTARHILEVRRELLNDPAGRVWQLQRCEIAQTDVNKSEISSVGYWGEGGSPRFRPAAIAYKPTDSQYHESAGLDFAVLKIASSNELPFAELVPQLVEMEKRSEIIAIGYPGRESASPQKLERFDGEFSEITYFDESPCDGTVKSCGFRYAFRRYPYNFQKDFWKDTSLGIITPYFRGGFSGGPAFLKGNLIGIVTHGRSGDETESGWDEAFILTSFDIFGNLKDLLDL